MLSLTELFMESFIGKEDPLGFKGEHSRAVRGIVLNLPIILLSLETRPPCDPHLMP